jgi:hypothetical protein
MLGVALQNEYLTLVLGISGCLVFLLVVTSRRDELANLRDDLHDRFARGRQEREVAQVAWEAIQRIELCTGASTAYEIVDRTARTLGCDMVQISCLNQDSALGDSARRLAPAAMESTGMSGPSAIFRLSCGSGLWITVGVALRADSRVAADIVFRYLQRMGQALAERLERLHSSGSIAAVPPSVSSEPVAPRHRDSSGPAAEPSAFGSVGVVMSRLLGGSAWPLSRSSRPRALNVPGPAAADVLQPAAADGLANRAPRPRG